jgi:hypothetical protein
MFVRLLQHESTYMIAMIISHKRPKKNDTSNVIQYIGNRTLSKAKRDIHSLNYLLVYIISYYQYKTHTQAYQKQTHYKHPLPTDTI